MAGVELGMLVVMVAVALGVAGPAIAERIARRWDRRDLAAFMDELYQSQPHAALNLLSEEEGIQAGEPEDGRHIPRVLGRT